MNRDDINQVVLEEADDRIRWEIRFDRLVGFDRVHVRTELAQPLEAETPLQLARAG